MLARRMMNDLGEFVEGDIEACVRPEYVQLVTVAVFWHGKVLLVRRQSEPFVGMYSIPGGHKEKGETYQVAARRELREETGIIAGTLAPMPIFIDHKHKLECHGFTCTSEDGVFSVPKNEEQEIVGWKNIADAIELPLTPGLRESLLKR